MHVDQQYYHRFSCCITSTWTISIKTGLGNSSTAYRPKRARCLSLWIASRVVSCLRFGLEADLKNEMCEFILQKRYAMHAWSGSNCTYSRMHNPCFCSVMVVIAVTHWHTCLPCCLLLFQQLGWWADVTLFAPVFEARQAGPAWVWGPALAAKLHFLELGAEHAPLLPHWCEPKLCITVSKQNMRYKLRLPPPLLTLWDEKSKADGWQHLLLTSLFQRLHLAEQIAIYQYYQDSVWPAVAGLPKLCFRLWKWPVPPAPNCNYLARVSIHH